jgi:hypothetical protein
MLATVPRATSPLTIAADRLRAGQRARAGLRPPTFASPEQEAFFESEAPELLYSGWMGAGKSRILCEKAWSLALHHPGAELGIFRKVRPRCRRRPSGRSGRRSPTSATSSPATAPRTWVDLAQPGNRPSRIWFLGLDPDPKTGTPTKVGSLNLDWAGVDEAIELTEADWIMLQGRLRRTAIGYRQIAAATNPASPRHWLKTHFTPATDERVFLVASGNTFLPADYQARLAGLGTGVHAQRLGKGLWVAAEGTIWLLLDEQIARPSRRRGGARSRASTGASSTPSPARSSARPDPAGGRWSTRSTSGASSSRTSSRACSSCRPTASRSSTPTRPSPSTSRPAARRASTSSRRSTTCSRGSPRSRRRSSAG